MRLRGWIVHTVAVVAVLGIAGLAAAALGLASVAASSGHWPVTDWFLHFAMRRAVIMRALGIETPPLDDPAMIALGAAHYSTGCAGCHGEPGVTDPRVAAQMTPPPPDLAPRIEQWRARELFWIVRHGIKFTGMPAWAALEREEEVWAVVAFLQKLPSLAPREYRRLARGPTPAAPVVRPPEVPSAGFEILGGVERAAAVAGAECARCHGRAGLGLVPRLEGLASPYLLTTLAAYGAGRRPSGIMEPVAARLEPETMRGLAELYAARAPATGAGSREDVSFPSAVERVRRIAELGIPARGVPSCTYCHGPDATAENPLFPALAGQPREYLQTQLELWVERGGRGGTPYARLMEVAVERLPPATFDDLAAYYASLPADR